MERGARAGKSGLQMGRNFVCEAILGRLPTCAARWRLWLAAIDFPFAAME
jgi:hypothetical protein